MNPEDFKCMFCNELEISIKHTEQDIEYYCCNCKREYNQKLLEQYRNMSIWQKIAFKVKYILKE